MKNVINRKEIQETAAIVMNDLRGTGAKIETMDDMYNVVSKYAHISRDKFDEMYKKVQDKDFLATETAELTDDELDAVAGGFDWKTFGIVAGCILAATLIMTGIGAAGGLGYAAVSTAYVAEGAEAVAMGYAEGATMWALAAADGAYFAGATTFGGASFITGLMAYIYGGINLDDFKL